MQIDETTVDQAEHISVVDLVHDAINQLLKERTEACRAMLAESGAEGPYRGFVLMHPDNPLTRVYGFAARDTHAAVTVALGFHPESPDMIFEVNEPELRSGNPFVEEEPSS